MADTKKDAVGSPGPQKSDTIDRKSGTAAGNPNAPASAPPDPAPVPTPADGDPHKPSVRSLDDRVSRLERATGISPTTDRERVVGTNPDATDGPEDEKGVPQKPGSVE